ncbi:MAG: hypothetical protein J3K34DRAFT_418836 [Monoraphidium minutum]|nr:MAG: hypothetical protein J3K34DRAFT_418836 [Monoraphidium minutum]
MSPAEPPACRLAPARRTRASPQAVAPPDQCRDRTPPVGHSCRAAHRCVPFALRGPEPLPSPPRLPAARWARRSNLSAAPARAARPPRPCQAAIARTAAPLPHALAPRARWHLLTVCRRPRTWPKRQTLAPLPAGAGVRITTRPPARRARPAGPSGGGAPSLFASKPIVLQRVKN